MQDAPEATEPPQDDVIAFLEAPESYSPAAGSVDRIDTHGAIVFLAGSHAYKIKRAVRLSYLDFSTLERRRNACEREFELNMESAPDLYLRVSPILRLTDGRLAWEGEGVAVEYVIVMRRFKQSQLLDEMAVAGHLDEDLMTTLADRIVEGQARAPVHRDVDPVKGFEAIIGNVTAAISGPGSPIDASAAASYQTAALQALRDIAPLMRERAGNGFVRRCHGDMHLRNIVLLDDGPTLFDALEFDEGLAIIDVLYGVAFLIMDLYRRGLRDLACSLLNQYLQGQAGVRHLEGLALLPLFLSCRAAIRAMVALDRKANFAADRASAVDDDVRQYFTLARQFLAPPPPRLIAVGGLSGTGKTTLARTLAPDLGPAPGAVHLRSDVERKVMYEWDPQVPLPEDAYSRKISNHVYRRLCDKAERVLKAGHCVIVDAVFAAPAERDDIEARAHAAGASFAGLWLTAPADVLCTRVAAREGDESDADAGVVRQQLSYETGAIAWKLLDVGVSTEEVHASAMAALGLPRRAADEKT